MDRAELGSFLRARRERIAPTDVGLPVGRRRRTPGLRREEVAQLAHVSVEHYTRLEQGRGSLPSREVVAALVRALRLDHAERDHLHHLAGLPPAPPSEPSREVRPSLQSLIDQMPDTAAMVLSATCEVIAWNHLATALMEDFSALSRTDRNLLRRMFLSPRPDGRRLYGVTGGDDFAASAAQVLRAAAGRYPASAEVRRLVRDLRAGSEEFERLWQTHDVAAQPTMCTTFDHPAVGPVPVSCDVLDVADRDQRVVLYTAPPGSRAAESLRLLSVLGTQRVDVPG